MSTKIITIFILSECVEARVKVTVLLRPRKDSRSVSTQLRGGTGQTTTVKGLHAVLNVGVSICLRYLPVLLLHVCILDRLFSTHSIN